MPPRKYPSAPLEPRPSGLMGRVFVPAGDGPRTSPAVMEWELRGESWTDEHPHDEFNYVLEGHLFVECDGVTVEARAGEAVQVPTGAAGRYWAPEYARLLAVYGPNPEGLPSRVHEHRRLAEDQPTNSSDSQDG
ncbi:cupin domain-containing protein [Streptomyces sp. NPDC000994]